MSRLRGIIVDVDGTVVRGNQEIEGAADAIARLRSQGYDLLFVSNNPTKPPADYVDRLGAHGIDVDPSKVLTAGTITADYLAETYPDATHFVFGTSGFTALLDDRGIDQTDDPDAADVVVASFDEAFDYDDLRTALWAYENGAPPLIGTDPDVAIPTEDRPLPGSGAVLRAVAGVAEREPTVVAGKPSEIARRAALDRLGYDPGAVLVVGDRPSTDIALAGDTEMKSALVLSGITDREDANDASVQPDVVLNSLAELPEWLE